MGKPINAPDRVVPNAVVQTNRNFRHVTQQFHEVQHNQLWHQQQGHPQGSFGGQQQVDQRFHQPNTLLRPQTTGDQRSHPQVWNQNQFGVGGWNRAVRESHHQRPNQIRPQASPPLFQVPKSTRNPPKSTRNPGSGSCQASNEILGFQEKSSSFGQAIKSEESIRQSQSYFPRFQDRSKCCERDKRKSELPKAICKPLPSFDTFDRSQKKRLPPPISPRYQESQALDDSSGQTTETCPSGYEETFNETMTELDTFFKQHPQHLKRALANFLTNPQQK